jgi:hypothetical protein
MLVVAQFEFAREGEPEAGSSCAVLCFALNPLSSSFAKIDATRQYLSLKISKTHESSLVPRARRLSFKKGHYFVMKRFFFVKNKQKTFVSLSAGGLSTV